MKNKTIIFNKSINNDAVCDLINTIEDNLEKKITIYFTTGGGNNVDAEILIEMLNNCEADITLVATWGINSNGFKVFFRVLNIKRRLMERAHSIIHLSSREIDTLDLLKKDTPEEYLMEKLEEQNEKLMSFYADLGITETELEKIKTGGEVTLGHDRLSEMLEKQKEGK